MLVAESDVLSGLDDVSEIALETTTPSSVLRPFGNDRYVHVIMPMFVQWYADLKRSRRLLLR